jgi:hypothetical protein
MTNLNLDLLSISSAPLVMRLCISAGFFYGERFLEDGRGVEDLLESAENFGGGDA